MPSQEDLDLENKNSLSNQRATRSRRSDSRAMKDKMNEALRGATSTKERREIKKEFRVDTNKASDQTDNQMGANEDSNQRGDDDFKPTFNNVENDGSGGGSGLPAYPGEEPSPVAVNTPLVWDDQNGDARWLVGDPQDLSDPKTYLDVFGYDPNPSTDGYSLNRFEMLDVIMCQDGEPVEGQILFFETEV